MELGEPDESGRRSPVPVPGSEYRVPVQTVVAAIGQAPNPTLQRVTPQLITKRGRIVIDGTGTKRAWPHVFGGGRCGARALNGHFGDEGRAGRGGGD